jgi:exopolysaccharide biosynthesis polyprenyl glycosylphosphotransferase
MIVLLCCDVIGFIVAATFASAVARTYWRGDFSPWAAMASALVAGALCIVLFSVIGLYRKSFALSIKDELYYTVLALSIGFSPLLILFTILPGLSTSRAALLSAYVASIVAVGSERAFMHAIRTAVSRRFPRRIAIVGSSQNVKAVGKSFVGSASEPVCVEIDDFNASLTGAGSVDEVAWFQAAREASCGTILLTEMAPPASLPTLLAAAAREHIDLAFALPNMRAHAYCVDVRVVGGQVLIVPKRLNACRSSRIFMKRIFDVVGALVMLALFSPVMIVAALAVYLESGAPVLFRQERVGLNGRTFEILKFRSMPVDVERATGAMWAAAGDKRPTRVGAFLRRTSLDELPQILNVLKGEMSIVGPRPERPVFVESFRREIARYDERHLVPPGITGWSHVHMKRNNDQSTIGERTAHDLFYIENWSMFMDISVIFKTAVEFLFHRAS